MKLLVIGCGYLGTRLAQLARERLGMDVAGFARNSETIQKWREEGFQVFHGDVIDPSSLEPIAHFKPDHILYCVAGGRAGGETLYRQIYLEGLKNVVAAQALSTAVPRIYFVSSTSVYPQDDGAWVDEKSPCDPIRPTARVLRQAEDFLLKSYPLPTVLRIAGIYGPGRSVLVDKIKSTTGQIIQDNPHRWLNLAHVDDISRALIALMSLSPDSQDYRANGIFNIVDDEPVQIGTYYDWVLQTFSLPPAQFAPGISKSLNKRVSHQKLKRTLGFECRYPSFREGLSAGLPIKD